MKLFVIVCVTILQVLFIHEVNSAAAVKIHWQLKEYLKTHTYADVFIEMKEDVNRALEEIPSADTVANKAKHRVKVVKTLKHHAKESQKKLLDALTSLIAQEEHNRKLSALSDDDREFSVKRNVKRFWISNEMFIQNAKASIIEKLAVLDAVSIIRMHESATLVSGDNEDKKSASSESHIPDQCMTETTPWSHKMIGLPKVWGKNITGKGVTVAIIDTGIRHTHYGLRENYRSTHGWHDPLHKTLEPADSILRNSTDPVLDKYIHHGTKTTGILASKKGFGVAPDIDWIGCRGCEHERSCQRQHLLACAEFVLCPKLHNNNMEIGDIDDDDESCEGNAPDVIVNSWYNGRGDLDYFTAPVMTWRKAGIIPVFATGNFGPKCSSITAPAHLPTVISVGSTLPWDEIFGSSSRGPTAAGLIKPDLVAPGTGINTPSAAHDCEVATSSGTSISAPIVGGVVALMLQANPELVYSEIYDVLTTTAEKVAIEHELCGLDKNVFPNNVYGHGRLNAFGAIEKALALKKSTTVAPTNSPKLPHFCDNVRRWDLLYKVCVFFFKPNQ